MKDECVCVCAYCFHTIALSPSLSLSLYFDISIQSMLVYDVICVICLAQCFNWISCVVCLLSKFSHRVAFFECKVFYAIAGANLHTMWMRPIGHMAISGIVIWCDYVVLNRYCRCIEWINWVIGFRVFDILYNLFNYRSHFHVCALFKVWIFLHNLRFVCVCVCVNEWNWMANCVIT